MVVVPAARLVSPILPVLGAGLSDLREARSWVRSGQWRTTLIEVEEGEEMPGLELAGRAIDNAAGGGEEPAEDEGEGAECAAAVGPSAHPQAA